ncbi:acyl carrier protein [Pyxidicoccus trucidator]|jgi:acyl carrier protein|uniref:acyl carrier protein n=1 Tax=Pyxidicoccus trucidator TaxID=2709662 RepID=UPI0013DCF7AF|nr:acyl carrier protein [Pyxidicoccus trucidator]
MSSLRERIRTFIVDTFFVDEFADDDSFLRKGLIDSTGMMELVAFLEQDFGLKLEDRELVPENLDSLSRVVAFVEKKQQQRLPQAG